MLFKKLIRRIQKSLFLKICLGILTVIILYLMYYVYQEIRSGYIKYREFGVKVPSGYEIHGIDVSKYQGVINWKSVKKMKVQDVSIDFAFIKATQGLRTIDLKYYQNMLRARQANVPVGSYHFFLTYRDATDQAKLFCSMASIKKGDLPPVIDVEEAKGQTDEKIRRGVQTWLDYVENTFDVRPIIYTNAGFYERYLAGHFDDYTLWVAHYKTGKKPNVSREWAFWQHSEEANINGIYGKVDFNVFNGDKEDLEQMKVK
jgi:lysozyme